jgi:bifunctional aspartokinase / homoserine dehydrogenase 1
MKVIKFGGTSVGSPDNIRRVTAIVTDALAAGPCAVVCSAFGGVTDLLIKAGKLAEARDEGFEDIYQSLHERHTGTISELLEGAEKQAAMAEVEQGLSEVHALLKGIFLLNELPDRTLAQLMSYGERLSNFIIAAVLRHHGVKAVYVNATQLVKTDSQFLAAKVDFEKTNKHISTFFGALNATAIVTGFIGSDDEDRITTIGRGGSDYTAAILGAAINASSIEIWTDVNGVLTADPRRVEQAFSVPQLSYREAMEMSHFGAKVIYPPTIQPALVKSIPLLIKNTFEPAHPGTLISKDPGQTPNMIKGISSISDMALLRVEGSGLAGVIGMASRLFNALSQAQVNIIFLTQGSSEYSICFGVAPADTERAKNAVNREFRYEIQNKFINPIVVERDNAIIAVIGENMMNVPGISAKLFKALGKNGINVKAIAQGSSELNITAVIDKFNEAKALNALHEIFFVSDVHSLNIFLVGPTGLIGSTLLEQIRQQQEYLEKQLSIKLNVTGMINSRKMLIESNGIDLHNWKEELDTKGEHAELGKFTDMILDLNFANSVFVDCSASKKVTEFYEKLLRRSVSVVTPNKIANTLSQDKYHLLRGLARKSNARFLYETNVGAGLPVINTLHALLNSGDRIIRIEAVLSGTLSFIFNNFHGKAAFSDVVLEAKEKGFTEPDPRDDLSGLDVARKALILSRETGATMELDDISVQNLVPENLREIDTPSFLQRLKELDSLYEPLKVAAEKSGKALRYMAVIEKGKVSIVLKPVDSTHPFYHLSGSDNMIVFTSERYKTNPLVVKGPGAGAEVTAAGVFAEIISIGNYMAN